MPTPPRIIQLGGVVRLSGLLLDRRLPRRQLHGDGIRRLLRIDKFGLCRIRHQLYRIRVIGQKAEQARQYYGVDGNKGYGPTTTRSLIFIGVIWERCWHWTFLIVWSGQSISPNMGVACEPVHTGQLFRGGGSAGRSNGADGTRSVLALGLSITLCANAAPAHRAKPPERHSHRSQAVSLPSERITAPKSFAVPGWTDEETRQWLDSATGPKD